jgi:hypothetical protein
MEALALARRTDDQDALGLALSVAVLSRWATGRVDANLALARELVALGERGQEAGRRADGLVLCALLGLERADGRGFKQDAAEVLRLAIAMNHQPLIAVGECMRALTAMLDGRLAEVEAHATKVLTFGAGDANLVYAYAGQIFFLRREQGRVGEVLGAIEQMLESSGGWVVLRALYALALLEAGQLDESRHQLDLLEGEDLEVNLPALLSSPTIAMLAEVAVSVGDETMAARAERLLRCHRGHLIVLMPGAACLGAADRYLAMLAAGRGDDAEAFELFERALTVEELAAAPTLTARTRHWYGRSLLSSSDRDTRERGQTMVDEAAEAAAALGMAGLRRTRIHL